jgi:PAS domain S-box-containing protein
MAPVRVLLVEDSDDDAVLVVKRLRGAGIDLAYHRVETAAAMADALDTQPPDIVISDNGMPTFSAAAALSLVRDRGLDIPFIVVSGQIGEEAATALMRAGAHDFVLKGSLARLPPAVDRELGEARERRERRRAEAALHAAEERFRLVAGNLRDVVFKYRIHPEPAMDYVSPAIVDLTGHHPTALYADPELIFAAVEPEDREQARRAWHTPPNRPPTTRWRRPDGSTVWIDQRLIPIRDATGTVTAVEGILRDVTDVVQAVREREELARQLHQAERLDSLGQLAGGIAHDFNNLLSVICSYTTFLQEELGPDHPARTDTDSIANAARQAAALTRQLLIFSRLEPSRPETLDLNSVVRDIERLLRRTIGEDIEFVIDTDPTIDAVTVDRSRMEQVIMNLVVNARAAMPDGGRLTIATHCEPAVDGPDRTEVVLTVTDTGCGMDAETRRRAFEPFFTTKSKGTGSGLGLATVYGVVADAGGAITIWSQPQRGTRFTIRLPAADRSCASPSTVHSADDVPRGAGENILLVEDDAAVREVTRRMLARGGYTVTEASSRDEAVRTLATTSHTFAVILCDVVMAGMAAREFIDFVRSRYPATPIVLMSGYTGEGRGTTNLPVEIPRLHKPFDESALLRHIGLALRTGPTG